MTVLIYNHTWKAIMWLGCNQLKNLKPPIPIHVLRTLHSKKSPRPVWHSYKQICLSVPKFMCLGRSCRQLFQTPVKSSVYNYDFILCKTSFVFGYIWAEWKWFWEFFSLLSIYLLISNVHELKIYFFIQYLKGWFLLMFFCVCVCVFFF